MKREPLTEEIKVRVPGWLKTYFTNEAQNEELELSDIVRRALKEYAKKAANPESAYARAA